MLTLDSVIPSPTVDDRARPEERRRNELYRQYYEELQRRYDTDRPVDCSVIVVNKAQKYVHSLFFTGKTELKSELSL